MTVEILKYPDKRLAMKSERAAIDNPELVQLARVMLSAVRWNSGIGLSAIQIGVPVRLILVAGPKEFWALANPELIHFGKKHSTEREGCLSIPGFKMSVKRPTRVTVEGYQLDWETEEWERKRLKLRGMRARIAQHEIDHLDGVMIIDRIPPELSARVRSAIAKKIKKGQW